MPGGSRKWRKPVHWVGGAKKAMQSLPLDVQDAFGRLLLDAQMGDHPTGARPFREGLPSDVIKLVDDDDGETYRAAYVVAFEAVVYVLDAFQKKSKSGIKTPRTDIDRVRKRYLAAKADYDKNKAAYLAEASLAARAIASAPSSHATRRRRQLDD
jgi:phage-related protein